MDKLAKNIEYKELVERIGSVYNIAKSNVISAVNIGMLNAYWEIGNHIVEYEQNGEVKANYGSKLLLNISKDLKLRGSTEFRVDFNKLRNILLNIFFRYSVLSKSYLLNNRRN